MRTQLLLVLVIIGICFNTNLQRKLDTVTKDSCEKEGKLYQEAKSATCKTGNSIFNVAKEEDCKAGEWTDGSCSLEEIKKETDCKGNPVYTAAITEEDKLRSLSDATCITKSGYSIKDSTRLSNEDECKKELIWTSGKCSTSTEVKNKDDCTKANPAFTNSTEAMCVEKTNSLNSLSFNIALILIICLLF